MPLSKAHKAETRARIVAAAGKLFRRHGFDGIGIEKIMAAAGLTHGGFYAHFPSKAALLAEVMVEEAEITQRLARRRGTTRAELNAELSGFLDFYLDPANATDIGGRCFLASLSNDTARAPKIARQKYRQTITDVLHEFKRGLVNSEARDADAIEALALAIGAITIARAVDDTTLAADILTASRKAIGERLK
ncbi:MAG: TetR/AcrR family transcriptional regulator [Alphaproteobacteria bacterium]|nr:TetR/AcrR family transcriptional regulator [Alphaproteobacteria bacterium]